MKLLVTGNNSFIGSSFIEQYEHLHLLSAPTDRQLNLLDEASIKSYFSADYFDVCLYAYEKSKRGESNALLTFRNLQRAAIINHLYRVVYIGDGCEYGFDYNDNSEMNKGLVQVKEEEFGRSIPAEQESMLKYLVANLIQKDKITINLRHFLVYGKNASPYDNVISAMAYYAAMGKDIVIEKDRLVSIVYIDDSLRIVNAAVNGLLEKGDYNVVEKSVKLTQVAKTLRQISGKGFVVKALSKDMLPEYTADNTKLLTALGKFKFTSLKNGLTELYSWIDAEKESFNEKRVSINV